MPWTPESGAPLSGAMSLTGIEESSMKLWAEFLAGYFDGEEHDVMGGPLRFPEATIVFQQANHPNEGLFVHITALNPGSTKTEIGSRGQREARNKTTWNFWVKSLVKKPREDGHNTESLCRLTSDRLYALLMSRDLTLPLNRRGLHSIRPNPPRLITSQDWSVRGIIVKGILQFDI
jgi:hypothetical protein